MSKLDLATELVDQLRDLLTEVHESAEPTVRHGISDAVMMLNSVDSKLDRAKRLEEAAA